MAKRVGDFRKGRIRGLSENGEFGPFLKTSVPFQKSAGLALSEKGGSGAFLKTGGAASF